MDVDENEEKVFEHFLEMLPKNRMGVIDEMQPSDRCRFTRCSKQSSSEAKSSKKYMYSLKIAGSSTFVNIEVLHGVVVNNRRQGYQLTFMKGPETRLYTSLNIPIQWAEQLDSSEDFRQHCLEEFRRNVNIGQGSIKKLRLEGIMFSNFNLGFVNLPNLRELYVRGNADILQIFSKLTQPLQTLTLSDVENSELLANSANIPNNMAENAERTFQHFSELSSKIRAIMIDEMEPKDRCRMTRCSKQLNKEAKASKKYIDHIRFYFGSPKFISIDVFYAKYENIEDRELGFNLRFAEITRSEKKMIFRQNLENSGVLHEEELDSSTDVLECAVAYLKELLESNQHCIRRLSIDGATSRTETSSLVKTDFEIDNWENLEVLDVYRNVDILKTLSKLRKPLKKLRIEGIDAEVVASYKEVFEVQNDSLLWDVNLDNQQFLQIPTKDVTIPVGKLTEIDIFNFIRSWQNGTIGKNIEVYRWIVKYSNFDEQKLRKLLRISENHENEKFEIKHFIESGKSATIWFDQRGIIRFNTTGIDNFLFIL